MEMFAPPQPLKVGIARPFFGGASSLWGLSAGEGCAAKDRKKANMSGPVRRTLFEEIVQTLYAPPEDTAEESFLGSGYQVVRSHHRPSGPAPTEIRETVS